MDERKLQVIRQIREAVDAGTIDLEMLISDFLYHSEDPQVKEYYTNFGVESAG